MEKQQLEALLKEMSLEEKVGQLFQIIGYYYVEEEECAERARRMLEELRKMGRGEEELADAETILEELT